MVAVAVAVEGLVAQMVAVAVAVEGLVVQMVAVAVAVEGLVVQMVDHRVALSSPPLPRLVAVLVSTVFSHQYFLETYTHNHPV